MKLEKYLCTQSYSACVKGKIEELITKGKYYHLNKDDSFILDFNIPHTNFFNIAARNLYFIKAPLSLNPNTKTI